MDGTLTLIFAKSKTIWDILMKISALLQLRPISILTKFQGRSSKIGSATPVRSFRRFWREIQILGTYDLDFCTKWVFKEVKGWWNLGVNIFKHFWEIQNWKVLFIQIPSNICISRIFKNCFIHSWLCQKWLKISTPKFHQLLTSMKTHFVQKIKVIGAKNLDFPPKTSKTSNGRGRPNFWAMPSKFGENWYWLKL